MEGGVESAGTRKPARLRPKRLEFLWRERRTPAGECWPRANSAQLGSAPFAAYSSRVGPPSAPASRTPLLNLEFALTPTPPQPTSPIPPPRPSARISPLSPSTPTSAASPPPPTRAPPRRLQARLSSARPRRPTSSLSATASPLPFAHHPSLYGPTTSSRRSSWRLHRGRLRC